ncbi:MAG: ATP-binding cassette domain-containing protein [Candidatus Campbellbacteria bacterium]|nr:ATP-binding cassette domain-containing protein [Candidatus Campbellbacteria bacterium]
MLKIKDGVFGYAGKPVTKPINFEANQKEVVSIIGPSGCGKTTILKTISGTTPILEGELFVDGEARTKEWLNKNTSRTLQNFPLLHWLTVEQNLSLVVKLCGIKSIDINHILNEFSAYHIKDKYPHELSGGERCRASISQSVINEPKILSLDEPFNGLDWRVKDEIATKLFKFAESHSAVVLFVTHDLYDATLYSKRSVVLGKNKPSRIRRIVQSDESDSVEQIKSSILEE